jgi:hypothetical protein
MAIRHVCLSLVCLAGVSIRAPANADNHADARAIIQPAVEREQPKQDPQLGSLTGRFTFDGEPPEPRDSEPLLARLEAHSALPRDSEGRVFGISILYQAFLQHNIRPRTTDQSLLVGKDRGVANIVVWAESPNIPWKPLPQTPRPASPTIHLRGGNFEPRLVLLNPDQPLTVANHDPVALDIHAYFRRNNEIIEKLPANTEDRPKSWTLQKAERAPIWYRCDQAPWAQGWIVVRDNPYAAVTDAEGRFTIPNLPQGEWEFRAWHERQGYLKHWPKGVFKQKIATRVNDLGTVALQPELFEKKE